jgi:8-amino-7-oxononanoate synthase
MDFTSALYLGWHHAKVDIPNWTRLSLGKPSVLEEIAAAGEVASAVARLQQQESGLVFSSTLHLFWDLFGWLSTQPVAIFYDREAYPLAIQVLRGIDRAKKAPIYSFSHLDRPDLQKQVWRCYRSGLRPIIVSDGWCTQCGQALPLVKYTRWLAPFKGLLIIDDTQAIGVIGQKSQKKPLYGTGGGGVLPWLNLDYENVLAGSSLAKGFGIPIAVLSGKSSWIQTIRQASFTRMHCSPPTMAQLVTARKVLENNVTEGEVRRHQLHQRIAQFQQYFRMLQPDRSENLFPVQHLRLSKKGAPERWHHYLKRQGIRTLLTSAHDQETVLTFLLRADHPAEHIKQLAITLNVALPVLQSRV